MQNSQQDRELYFKIMKEIWKDVVGYEGLYKVSSEGNVMSLNYNSTGKEKIMKGSKSRQGYIRYRLTKNKIEREFSGHRLVIINFLENTENKEMCNHINGVKADNRLENLEWATRSENEKHKYTHLGIAGNNKGRFGGRGYGAKEVIQYSITGEFIKKWDCSKVAADKLGISRKNIPAVINGKRNHAGGFKWGR